MHGVGVLGVALLLAAPAHADEPDGPPAREVFAWLAAGGAGHGADRNTSFWASADPSAQAVAAGAMATLGANLAPNPLAACWVQFPVAAPPAGRTPPAGTAAAVVALASGPLVLYGGRPGLVGDYPGPLLGPYPRYPLGSRLGGAGGGVPIVSAVGVPGVEFAADPPLNLDTGRGVSDTTGLAIPPGGWSALALETAPAASAEGSKSPGEPARETAAPPAERAPIATPEPGTLLLAGLGLASLAGVRRKRP